MINLNLYGYSTDANSFVNKVTQLQSKISNLVSNTINDDKNGAMFKLFVSSKDFNDYKDGQEYEYIYDAFIQMISPFNSLSDLWNIWKMGDLYIVSSPCENNSISDVKFYIVGYDGNTVVDVRCDSVSIILDAETGDGLVVVGEAQTKTNKTKYSDIELNAMVRELFENTNTSVLETMFILLS